MDYSKKPNNTLELIDYLKTNNIPESHYKEIVNRFWETKARRLGIPLQGVFELTPLCNLDCKMCYVHLSQTQFDSRDLLSVNVWKELMNNAHNAGMLKATLTGGECLTYPGFKELYLHLFDMGIKPGILSNGVLIDSDMVLFFKKYRPSAIQISLYGSSNDEYEKVTGHKLFSVVFNNLLLMKDASLPVNITITPNKYMDKNIEALLNVIETLGLPYNINARLIDPRSNTKRIKTDITDDEYVDIYKLYRKRTQKTVVEVDPVELPDEGGKKSDERIFGLKCGAGRSSFTIKYDGLMCPCVCLDGVTSDPLELGFEQSWKRINGLANSYIMPIECSSCVYHTQCLLCPAMHKDAPVGHCDHRICELTKKMVSAGVAPVPKKQLEQGN